jgi:hypothetical protein
LDVCPLWLLGVNRWRSVRRADPTFRGVVPIGIFACDLETSRTRRSWPAWGYCAREKKVKINI